MSPVSIFLSPLKQGMDFFTGGSIIMDYGLMEATVK